MNYYVYIYYDPRKQPPEPIYVGKGQGRRFKHHITKETQNKHLCNKLKKIKKVGMEPIIKFAKQNITEQESIDLEIELIAKIGRADKNLGPLCNWTDGGEGTSGYRHSKKTKQMFSEQRKGKRQTEAQYKANCSRKVSDEAKLKMSKVAKGHRRHTIEQIEAIKYSNSHREIKDETRVTWSKTRLNNTPTKIHYPPLEEIVAMIAATSRNKVAIKLGINYASLTKYLKRRNVELKDARFKK